MHPSNVFAQIVVVDGIDTDANNEHPLKAFSLILSTEEGIVICAKDVHSSKALFSISFTEEGINICVNDEHL